jgi:uncharacterized protein YeaO (DUF488 family)
MGEITVSRVYDHDPARGKRGKGGKGGKVYLAAPSTELRRWYDHEPGRWAEFQRRYTAELDARPDAWRPLAEAAEAGHVTLLYSSRERERNNAVVLRDYLLARLREP